MLQLAISPCPNDTTLFYPWLAGLIGQDLPAQATFADIQRLNEWALERRFPLIKLSFATLGRVLDHYQLLPVGAALGFNCGPKIIAKTPFPLSEIGTKRIAVPGRETTANLLFDRLIGGSPLKVYCLFHEIADLIQRGEADCGLIIHETRFTFARNGFVEIADLGEMWHAKYALPLPLGGLAIARDFQQKSRLIEILREALAYPDSKQKLNYIQSLSQEKDPDVIQKHITTYVNGETAALSDEGVRAIEVLLCRESSELL